ncbi:MAG: cytochrome c oxidase subunit II [Ignavibacteriaceae bacterium]|jgi:cytochrome c oxidase subunit II
MSGGASNFVESVDGVFLFSIIMSVFFLVLITGMMLLFVIKYNRKRNPKAVNVHSNTVLEVTWTVIPTILVLILFWYGWVGYKDMSDIPENAMTIEVTAQMWKWQFKYDDGRITDSLYVPVDQPVVLDLKSLDVNHAFFIPDFRVKKDIYPGFDRKIWFIPYNVGEYNIFCAEYCGMNHSYMLSKIFVMPQGEFNNWKKAGNNKELESPNGENETDTTKINILN